MRLAASSSIAYLATYSREVAPTCSGEGWGTSGGIHTAILTPANREAIRRPTAHGGRRARARPPSTEDARTEECPPYEYAEMHEHQ